MDINKHPLIKRVYELCLLIEKLPASKQQTDVSVAASVLMMELDKFLGGLGECSHVTHATLEDVNEWIERVGAIRGSLFDLTKSLEELTKEESKNL